MPSDSMICFRLAGPERAELEAVAHAEREASLSALVRRVTRDFVTAYLRKEGRDNVIEQFRLAKTREAEEQVRRFEEMLDGHS